MDFDSAMREVLRQSKYDRLTGRLFDWQGWLRDRAMELLRRVLDSLDINFGSLFRPGSNGWVDSWIGVLRALGIILAVFIAVKLALYIVKRIKQKGKAGVVFDGIDQYTATAGGLLDAADRLASGGYQRDAVRYCLAAILLALDRGKVYRMNYTKTNGQILRELREKTPAIVPPLSAVVDVFNAVWFGHRSISRDQFDKYWRESCALAAEVEAHK